MNHMSSRSWLLMLVAVVLGTGLVALAQQTAPPPTTKNPPLFKGDKNKKDDGTRFVQGTVKNADDQPVTGAIVKLKDTKSLTIRSFITKSDGQYSFQGLSKGVDYELKAEGEKGAASSTKLLSVFDNRKEPVINLKIEPKASEEKK